MKQHFIDILIIAIIIIGLTAGAFLLAGWMSDDIEAKNIAICPSDERVWEPNEPKAISFKIDVGDNSVEFIDCTFTFDEPNEPECKHAGHSLYGYSGSDDVFCSGCNKAIKSEPFTSVLQFIPTYPDYIELEKDLWLDERHKSDPNDTGSGYDYVMIEKGTRIYFKEK